MSATRVNSRNPIVLCCAAALATALSTVQAVELDPPAPNPADPVDYIAWVNRTLGTGAKNSAAAGYAKVVEKSTPIAGDWGRTLDGPWTGNTPVERFISANREAFKLYRAAAQREKYGRVVNAPPGNDPRMSQMLVMDYLPDFRPHRDVTRGLIAEGYRAWASGDQTLLTKNASTVLRAAHHLFSGTTAIERLVGTAEAALAYSAMAKALELSNDPDALAAQLREELDRVDPEFPAFAGGLLFERLAARDVCQRVFVPGSQPGRWKLYEPLVKRFKDLFGAEISRRDAAAIGRIGFDETVREIDEYYDAFEQWVHTPYHLTSKPEGREKEHIDKFAHIPIQTKNPLVQILLPDLTRSRELDERINATRKATHLIVMLFLHRAEHGKFPRKLDELTSGDLSSVRTDPFSGKDFVYTRKRRGKIFALYSISENLTDEGGRKAQNPSDGDLVFWPIPK